MGDKDDYLTCYRVFFERFAATVYVDDQLPVNIGGYTITEFELPGEVIYWTTQYLTEKQCPPTLMTPLQRIILDEVRAAAEKHPKEFGFHTDESAFIALRLMQAVIARVNAVCLRYLDNSQLDSLPPPALLPRDTRTVALATKNIRRVMEDRHVVIGNLEALFGIEATEPTSFYAVYDGHAGSAAATYCAAHLHQYLVESRDFQTDLQRAVREAFLRTDAQFVRKSNHKRMCGGSTAVAVVVRGRLLLAAWAGDSLALLAKRMRLMQLVHPHKPDREDERLRIESSGGTVIHYGTWRVNGQLAVSRAIGDAKYKPYVTARPEFTLVELDGDEDFVVLASDGLWDFVNEDMVAHSIYTQVAANPDDLEAVTRRLIAQAKEEGSLDNISVVVVFLKDPRDIVAETYPPMDLGLDNALSNAPRFGTEADGRKPEAVPMGIDDCEADAEADNGISDSDSEDFGPETAVDADDVDDADADLHHHEPAPPTPPAHAVEEGHVDGVLVDNVAESGEDSEDEWNYYKGEGEPEPDEQNPSEEADDPPRSDTPCQDNSAWESSSVDMNSSPLNPDAPVFVPGGVAGSDVLLAESPRKPLPMDDIELPDVAQFQTEAVIRPAELVNLDNSDHLNGHHNISMDGATEHINGNGKCDMDSLGFGFNVNVEPDKIKDTSLIQEFERIQKDTTDYCDVQIFQAHETNPFDDGDDELFERLKNKERDPMSMSFYQEKDDDTCERFTKIEGHIDLNAVQPLPDSDDEDIQPNGAYDTPIQNDKENVPPEQKISLLDQEDIQEPNNDILKFEDRADNVVGNITNLDNSMDYNIDNTNNMQSYSNVEFECTNIPQDVLQTDTPESHKLLFEQIPEIPDGKSSELGFTNDDLQDRSESDKDIRVITPEDEISQDIESKFDESPIADSQTDYIEADIKDDLEQEKEIELESDTQSKEINEATVETTDDLDHSETINEPVLSLESAIIDQTQAVMHHIPSEKEQVQSINFEDNAQNLDDISEIKDNVILDKMDNIEDDEDDMKDSGDVKETPEVELVSVDDQDNIVPKSTLPSASPVPSPLPSESPLPILKEIPSSPILETKSPIPTDETVEFESRSPLPSQSPIPADLVVIQTSPVPQDIVTLSPIPAEVPLPRESPVPSESPVPQEMQCVEDDLPCESSMPSDLHVQVDTPLLVESPLPVESHVPDALLCDAALSVKPDSCVVSPLPTDNSMVSDSSLPKEAIIEKEIVTNYATVLSESPLPTDKALMEETIIADNLVPTETLEVNKDTLISESPLPTELSQPRESPLPTDELIPKSPLLVEPSSPQTSPLPTESIISESTLPIDDVQVVESPLPQELLPEHKSPIPEELSQPIEPIQLNETTSLTEAQLEPELHSQINEVQSVESLPQLENTSPVQSHDVSEYPTETINIAESPNVSISPAPVVASPAPSPSPAPVETITEDVRHLDMKDTVADFVCELRLTPPVTQDTVEEPVKLDSVAHSEAMLLEASSGPTPDIVPDERVDLPITRNELVTDIDIGIPESRAQEICVPVTSEIQQDDAMEPAVGTPPPTPAVKSLQMLPATLDIPPLSETPMAGDAGALAAAAAVTAGAAAITAATATTKAKTPATKKSPTTPTAKTPKTVPKSTPTPRTPASAAKKTGPASPAAKTPAASKPAAARTSLSAKSTPATKPASKPTTPLSKTLTPVSKPTTKPSPAPVKEAPAVAKAAPARTATARLPAKPTSAKPATTASKTSTAAAKPSAPRPTPRPAAARPATTTTAAPTAAKPKDIKPKTTTPKALANGDVKSAAKPAPKPALTARLPAAKPAPKPAPRSTAAPPASNVAPAKAAAPRMAAKAPLDKQSKDLANKRITAKAAPPRTAPAKAPTSAKSAAAKTGPKKVELPKKDEVRQNGLANGSAPIKPPPSPPPADNALLPDVIA